MASNSTLRDSQIPSWLPAGFQVAHDGAKCVTASRQLTSFAIWNAIAIASFVLSGNTLATKWIFKKSRARTIAQDKWSFLSAISSLCFQLGGILLTTYLIQESGYRASMWQLVQLWALRPRATWFIGNCARIKREWGYVNGALSSIFAEVFISGLALVFIGRILEAAFTHMPKNSIPPVWWYVIVVASMAALLSIGFEILWALWMTKRVMERKGQAKAQDMDSLLWIVRMLVPVTALCSWLIWSAFLYSTEGAYCPATFKYIDLVWGLIPLLANSTRMLIQNLGL